MTQHQRGEPDQVRPTARRPAIFPRRAMLRLGRAAVAAAVLYEVPSLGAEYFVNLVDTHLAEDQRGLARLGALGERTDLAVQSRRPEARLPWDASVSLRCHLFQVRNRPRNRAPRCVILVPGWQDTATGPGWIGCAAELLKAGDDVIMMNVGAGGPSTGVSWGLGTLEQHDVTAVYQAALRRGYRPESIGFIAESMGAAALLEAIANDRASPGNNIREAAIYVLVAPYNRFRAVLEHVGSIVAPWLAFLAGKQSEMVFGVDPIDQRSLGGPVPGFPGDRMHIYYNPMDNTTPESQVTEIRRQDPRVHLHRIAFTSKRPAAHDLHQELSFRIGEPPVIGEIVASINRAVDVVSIRPTTISSSAVRPLL